MALDTSIREIIQLCNDRSSPCEFLYGAAGGLYCVRFLRRIYQLVSKIIMEHHSWTGEFYIISTPHGSAGIIRMAA